MSDRLKTLRSLLDSNNLDGYIVANRNNMVYLAGFSGGSLLLVPRIGESILFVYRINHEAAKEMTKGARVELIKTGRDFAKHIANEISCLNLRRIGFDSMGASRYLQIKELIEETDLKDAQEIMLSLRRVKNKTELALMERAAKMTSLGMNKAIGMMTVGLKERDIAAEIEYEMRKSGSDGVAFETIVSSGPRSAFPHGGCGDREIKKGDFVVIDVGARCQDYCADLTRTFIVGKPLPKQVRIFETVRKAQSIAMDRIRAGVYAKDIDNVARRYIAKMGYDEYFVHSLGHGVGLDIHEPPVLGRTSKDTLASGNVVTVEPGIYIPRFGGVRIEDTVVVLDEAARKLTDAPIMLVQ